MDMMEGRQSRKEMMAAERKLCGGDPAAFSSD